MNLASGDELFKDVVLLRNTIRPYAWGSTDFIPRLLGVPVTGEPAAELWLGAHPSAPSRTEPADLSLADVIAHDPGRILGRAGVAEFGPTLPFLLKVLAAERPLSIQAHPTRAQAEAGCADEDSRGIDRLAPDRNYVDANHKPELICALTDFQALCGFRPVDQTAQLLSDLESAGAHRLAGFADRVVSDGGLRELVTTLLSMPASWRADVLASVLPAAAKLADRAGPWAAECAWTGRLAQFYPGDGGVVLALLLNLVQLQPGQALFLGAGRIHAYLHGAGVELMASSDNVLRCGLTSKHVDPPELLRVLDFSTEEVHPLSAAQDGPWARFPVPVEDFTLSRLTNAGPAQNVATEGPQILLVTEGSVQLAVDDCEQLLLGQGQSAFVIAGAAVEASGEGVIFQATTNLGGF